jgi:hypothetical protein
LSTTSSASSTSSTTTTIGHSIALTVSLNNLTQVASEELLLQQLTQATQNSAGTGATVTVVIHYITVKSTYAGFITINHNDIITAYAAMANISISRITVNNQTYVSGGRRLTESAEILAQVDNEDGVDVVQKSKSVADANNAAVLLDQLRNVDPVAYATTGIGLTSPPISLLSATTKVTGTPVAPAAGAVQAQVASSIPGGGTVTVSVSSNAPTTTAPSTTSYTWDPNVDDDHAPLGPMMTVWFAIYAFLTH